MDKSQIITIQLTQEQNQNYYNSDSISLNIEEYLQGSVAQEIGNAAIEACKAQAVACRTNAYYKQNISDKSSSFQAFNATKINNDKYKNVQQAIKDTIGEILYYNDKIAYPASFSSSNGGQITSSLSRWGTEKKWLVDKIDPYDTVIKKGHGVGMSQAGAKKMAELGFTYKDILSFYYPNTVIKKYNEIPGAQKDKIIKIKCISNEEAKEIINTLQKIKGVFIRYE